MRGMFFLGYSFLMLLFFAAPFVLSLRAVWLCISRPKRFRAEPACEKCRYVVTGLAGLQCPECGTDLRRSGIITPAMEMRRRGSLFAAIVGWTFVMFILGFVGLMFWSVFNMLPSTFPVTPTGPLWSSCNYSSASGAFASVTISASMDTSSGKGSEVTLKLDTKDNRTFTMDIHATPGGTTTVIAKGPQGEPIEVGPGAGAVEMTALMQAAGIDVSDEMVVQEADDIASLVTVGKSSPYALLSARTGALVFGASTSNYAVTSGVTPPSGSDPWVIVLVGSELFLMLTWVGGIVFLVMRRARLMKSTEDWDRGGAATAT